MQIVILTCGASGGLDGSVEFLFDMEFARCRAWRVDGCFTSRRALQRGLTGDVQAGVVHRVSMRSVGS
jgi:hypothetical protein